MFKCSICGKEYSDNDMNEMRLLNRQTNELETFHVCSTCINNKEDIVAYLAGKKNMSPQEARHLYDYFVPLLNDVESDLLAKYLEVRVKSLRGKLADNIEAEPEVQEVKAPVKKKMSVFKRLKATLITLDAVISISLFAVLSMLSVIHPSVATIVVLGLIVSIAIFVGGYFAIDNYVRMKEETYNAVEKLRKSLFGEDPQEEQTDEPVMYE